MYPYSWNKTGLFFGVTCLCLCFVLLYIYSVNNNQVWYTQVHSRPQIFSTTFHIALDDTKRDNYTTEPNDALDDSTSDYDTTKSNDALDDNTRDYYTTESNVLEDNKRDKYNETFSRLCKKLTFPSFAMKANQWQVVGTNKTGFVYSAFRETNTIKVIGLSFETGQFVCQLWYTKSIKSVVYSTSVQALVQRIHQPRDTRYRCAVFTCTLPQENIDGDLLGVSLSTSPCHQPTNLLPVFGNGYSNVSNKYTLCVSPLHDNYSRAHELVEWIELNRILGADRFIFYNLSCSPLISRILNSYEKAGIASVFDWKLPHQHQNHKKDTWYFGQVSALNDCLLRIRGHSQFIVDIDLDEFIIPRQKNVLSWNQMLKRIPKYDVYHFSNSLFKSQKFDARTNYSWYQNASRLHLITLLKLSRDLMTYNGTTRSKYIARTQSAEILGVHKVWKTTGKVLAVPRSLGLLHHYRENENRFGSGKLLLDDTVVKKYKETLIKRVSQKWERLTGIYGKAHM